MNKRRGLLLNVEIALVASFFVALLFVVGASKNESFKSLVFVILFTTSAYLITATLQFALDKTIVSNKVRPFISISILGSVLATILANVYAIVANVESNSRPPEKVFQGIVIAIALSLWTLPFTALYYYAPNLMGKIKTRLKSKKFAEKEVSGNQ